MSKGKILLGVAAGVAVGAALGILMAPDKGSETRKKIAKKGGEYTDNLKKRYEGLRDKYNNTIDEVSNKLDSAASNGHSIAKTVKTEVKDAANTITR